MELSVALMKCGLGGLDGLAAARMKVTGENPLQPYTFFALYLKAYLTPFVTLTLAYKVSVSVSTP